MFFQCFLWWILAELPNGHEVIQQRSNLLNHYYNKEAARRDIYFLQERNLFLARDKCIFLQGENIFSARKIFIFFSFFLLSRQKSISITMLGNPCQPHKSLGNPLFLPVGSMRPAKSRHYLLGPTYEGGF